MSIIIEQAKAPKYNLSINDVRDGRAYEMETGEIIIGNKIGEWIAFGLNGDSVWDEEARQNLREITLRCIVEDLE